MGRLLRSFTLLSVLAPLAAPSACAAGEAAAATLGLMAETMGRAQRGVSMRAGAE